MLIHNLLSPRGDFTARLRLRAACYLFLALAGVALVAFGQPLVRLCPEPDSGYAQGLLPGAGLGLAAAGLVQLARIRRILQSPEKLQQQRLAENDERILWVRARALSICACLLGLGLYIGVLVAAFYNPVVSKTLLAVLCSFLVMVFGVNRMLLAHS